MAEEPKAQETTDQADQQAEEATDWQAKYEEMRKHSREWEKQAKANKGAADELEKLKAAQMTEQEKALARAEKAEQQLAQLQAEQQRAADAAEVAKATGVPLPLLEYIHDRDTMERFASTYAQTLPEVHAAGRAVSSATDRSDGKPTNAAAFEQFMRGKLNI